MPQVRLAGGERTRNKCGALCFYNGAESATMSSPQDRIAEADRRIEQLKLRVQQQIAYVDCLQREHYDVKRERRALDAMLAELSLMIGIGGRGIEPPCPLPHHPACGSAPGGSMG
jgi:hypothetical protein